METKEISIKLNEDGSVVLTKPPSELYKLLHQYDVAKIRAELKQYHEKLV